MILVREASADELGELAELTVEAYEADYHDHLQSAGWTGYREEIADIAARAAAGTILVAEENGALLGTVSVMPSRDARRVYFRTLAVRPSARRRGVASALVRAVVERARREGRSEVAWYTSPLMQPAIGLYAAMGFEPREPEDDTDPEPGVLFYVLALDGL